MSNQDKEQPAKADETSGLTDQELDQAAQADQLPSLEAQLEEALAKVKAWEEEYLRARADMENLRKRSAQEVINAGKFAICILELLS